MGSQAALIALMLVATASLASAGCYRNGHKRPTRAGAELRFNHRPAKQLSLDALPAEFTWANHNGQNWLTPSWNQHIPQYCGSCWAHGTLSMIQDRLKIAKLRAGDVTPDVMLGRQTLLNCAPFHNMSQGCDGGDAIDVFHYMAKFGLPDESCLHYMASDYTAFKEKGMKRCPPEKFCVNCMPAPTKKDPDAFECWPIKKPVLYTLSRYGKLDKADEAGMMTEIFERGPITCGVSAPDDFVFKYHSSKQGGVYVDNSGDTEIDHDVEVVGWGVDKGSGLKYWLVRNSWGTYWGELGFFKVQRGAGGNGALQIESGDCWYAEPEHSVEDAVFDGDLEGSMYGLKRKSDRDLATDRLQPAWADWPPAERQPAAGAADAPAPEAGARMAELSLARESQTPAQAFASAAAQLFAMVMGWGQPAPAPAPLSAPSVAEA